MFDVTRLRRLDALFAERVLKNDIRDDMCITPHYTRSLDAAWEGADRNGWDVSLTTRGRLDMFTTVDVIGYESDTHGHSREVAHPAEALVLACLRAVGVEESELQ